LSVIARPSAVAIAICAEVSRWKRSGLRDEQDLIDRRQLTEQPEKRYNFAGRTRSYRPIEQLRFELAGTGEKTLHSLYEQRPKEH
jgi:hypothetical protein